MARNNQRSGMGTGLTEGLLKSDGGFPFVHSLNIAKAGKGL